MYAVVIKLHSVCHVPQLLSNAKNQEIEKEEANQEKELQMLLVLLLGCDESKEADEYQLAIV